MLTSQWNLEVLIVSKIIVEPHQRTRSADHLHDHL